jgi:hypothetical protein
VLAKAPLVITSPTRSAEPNGHATPVMAPASSTVKAAFVSMKSVMRSLIGLGVDAEPCRFQDGDGERIDATKRGVGRIDVDKVRGALRVFAAADQGEPDRLNDLAMTEVASEEALAERANSGAR